jgi:folate-dependent phosphoribosylglycinamide formyltransferase PurN
MEANLAMNKVLFGGTRVEALKAVISLGFKVDIITFPDTLLKDFLDRYEKFIDQINEIIVVERERKLALSVLEKFLRKNTYAFFLSVGFPFIIPSTILNSYQTTFLNCHPHILPKWKGYSCIKESFEKGEKIFGATLHYMEENVDEGRIIYQYEFILETTNIEVIYDLTFSIAEPIAIVNGIKKIMRY